jgi:nitrogenase molybdenum-iron protein alpha/beta subunit
LEFRGLPPPVPEGIAATSEWFRQIGKYFGSEIEKKAGEVIERKEKETWESIAGYMPIFKGKRAAVFAGPGRTPSIAAACAELGMDVVYLSVWGVRERTLHAFKWFYDKFGQDPEVIVEPSVYEDLAVIDRLKVDIWPSDYENILTAMKHGVVGFEVMAYLPPHLGYEGMSRLTMSMATVLRNPIFSKHGPRIQNIEYTSPRYIDTCSLRAHPVNKSCMNEFNELEEAD